jgi:CDP-diacylglycerol--serine O-phosphatidyltransferase
MTIPGDEGRERRFRMRRRRRPSRSERRRAIFLLPNLITTAAILLGFWSIVQSFHGRFDLAALGIVLAGVCDVLDGRIARATHSTSKFGVEYDSLADMLAYGVAPAVLIYLWALVPLGPRGWLIASLFTVCAALRLARFNVVQHVEERTRYQGLPSTVAGGFVAIAVWFVEWLGLVPPFTRALSFGIGLACALLALLMVSNVPYLSTKKLPLRGPNAYPVLVAGVLLLIVILMRPEPVLFGLGVTYVASGPLLWLFSWRRSEPAPAAKESPGDVR